MPIYGWKYDIFAHAHERNYLVHINFQAVAHNETDIPTQAAFCVRRMMDAKLS